MCRSPALSPTQKGWNNVMSVKAKANRTVDPHKGSVLPEHFVNKKLCSDSVVTPSGRNTQSEISGVV